MEWDNPGDSEDVYFNGGGCLTALVIVICVLALVGLVLSGCATTPNYSGEFGGHVEVNKGIEDNEEEGKKIR